MDKTDKRVMKSIRSQKSLCDPFIKLSMILKTGGIEADGYLGMCGDIVYYVGEIRAGRRCCQNSIL